MWPLPSSGNEHESRVTVALGVTRTMRDDRLAVLAHEWLYGRITSREESPNLFFGEPDLFDAGLRERQVERVWVAPGNRSRTEAFSPGGELQAVLVTNQRYRAMWGGAGMSRRFHKRGWPADDLMPFEMFNDHGRSESAMALTHPGYFTHGLVMVPGTREMRLIDPVLGRPVRRLLLNSTGEAAAMSWQGTDIRTPVLPEAQRVELMVDEEFDVIVAWTGLFEGKPYAQTRFHELDFDATIDPARFELSHEDVPVTLLEE